MEKIVLNIPHSSTGGLFDRTLGGWQPHQDFLNRHVRKLTDWYADFLFSTARDSVVPVVFPYSRFIVDVERLPDDSYCEPGQGRFYEHIGGFRRPELTPETRTRLESLYDGHIQKLVSEITPDSALLDCHTFSGDSGSPDICIGFNPGSDGQNLANSVADAFRDRGYTIGLNSPYVGSLYPETGFGYITLMVEVNKRLYLDEATLTVTNDPKKLTRWFGTMDSVYRTILEYRS